MNINISSKFSEKWVFCEDFAKLSNKIFMVKLTKIRHPIDVSFLELLHFFRKETAHKLTEK